MDSKTIDNIQNKMLEFAQSKGKMDTSALKKEIEDVLIDLTSAEDKIKTVKDMFSMFLTMIEISKRIS